MSAQGLPDWVTPADAAEFITLASAVRRLVEAAMAGENESVTDSIYALDIASVYPMLHLSVATLGDWTNLFKTIISAWNDLGARLQADLPFTDEWEALEAAIGRAGSYGKAS